MTLVAVWVSGEGRRKIVGLPEKLQYLPAIGEALRA